MFQDFLYGVLGKVLTGVLTLIFSTGYFIDQFSHPEPHPVSVRHVQREYDFIVVGGGSAGAVVASRLSEVEGWSVLLVEAGGVETITSDIPLFSLLQQGSSLDWNFESEPNGKSFLGSKKKNVRIIRGKVLGGSSVLNYMLYVRGNKRDFDHWESLGNPGWGWDDVLPYFKKSEDNLDPVLASSPYHSSGGPLTVQRSPYQTVLAAAFIRAGQELGYPETDVNGHTQSGFANPQGTIRRGTRCSTARAFLRPARGRPNLHVTLDSRATRLLVEPRAKVARGVHFERGGRLFTVRARKEVVVSAGAIGSPHLLMLSGLGPSGHLASLGIPVVRHLPGVGKNLQDHMGCAGIFFEVDRSAGLTLVDLLNPRFFLEYIYKRTGPLTMLGGIEGVAFINTKYANASADFADVELVFTSVAGPRMLQQLLSLREDIYVDYLKHIENKAIYSITTFLTRPRSRGSITLKSRNPFIPPRIDLNYFSDPQDLKVLVEGMKMTLKVGHTKAMREFGSRPFSRSFPGCGHHPQWSDPYLECLARHFTLTIYHMSGTCKMGPRADPDAVVDDRLRVHGIQRLRVADASIQPSIVTGHVNAPAIMIGEKVADMIKQDWLASPS